MRNIHFTLRNCFAGVPHEAIIELPVVRRKLLETHRRRYIDR